MFVSTDVHVIFPLIQLIKKKNSLDISLQMRGNTEYSKPWILEATFLCEMKQFLFMGDFWNVGQSTLKQRGTVISMLLLRHTVFS